MISRLPTEEPIKACSLLVTIRPLQDEGTFEEGDNHHPELPKGG